MHAHSSTLQLNLHEPLLLSAYSFTQEQQGTVFARCPRRTTSKTILQKHKHRPAFRRFRSAASSRGIHHHGNTPLTNPIYSIPHRFDFMSKITRHFPSENRLLADRIGAVLSAFYNPFVCRPAACLCLVHCPREKRETNSHDKPHTQLQVNQ